MIISGLAIVVTAISVQPATVAKGGGGYRYQQNSEASAKHLTKSVVTS